jgi:hypothetical protein
VLKYKIRVSLAHLFNLSEHLSISPSTSITFTAHAAFSRFHAQVTLGSIETFNRGPAKWAIVVAFMNPFMYAIRVKVMPFITLKHSKNILIVILPETYFALILMVEQLWIIAGLA